MCCCSNSDNNNNPPATPGTGPCPPGGGSACPKKVTVVINLSLPVACPGHPFLLTAVGTPSGGTYAWTHGGEGEMVDSAGHPVSTGDTVYLRGFKTDDATGKILEQNATFSVTYTHPDGTANDSKPVKIHKIDFEVTNTAITAGVTQANESAGGLSLGNAPGVATMSTNPQVKIKLDPSCPRKSDCAQNHQAGWLQTVTSHTRFRRYRHSTVVTNLPTPIRDIIAGPFPFYQWVQQFTGDGDQETIHHEDSPSTGSPWTDPRAASPAPPPAINKTLRSVNFQEGFTAWLVVQNKEWATHDLPGGFAYQKHFNWSLSLSVTVDMTQAVGSRATPQSNPPTIDPSMSDGKGGDPDLNAPTANGSMTQTITAAPAG